MILYDSVDIGTWYIPLFMGFTSGLVGKGSPAVWKTWILSLGWENPLGKGMATHSSILAWRIPWTL